MTATDAVLIAERLLFEVRSTEAFGDHKQHYLDRALENLERTKQQATRADFRERRSYLDGVYKQLAERAAEAVSR